MVAGILRQRSGGRLGTVAGTGVRPNQRLQRAGARGSGVVGLVS